MPFIRLSDDYNDHPKFDNLCDGAFRLWHQGMGFCRKYQTDGLIPSASVRQFKAYSPKRMRQLLTPWKPDANALWQEIAGFGVKVHDYLDWNLSKEEENEVRDAAKARMRRHRSGVRSREQGGERSPFVPEREGKDLVSSEKESEKTPSRVIAPAALEDRARELLANYAQWYRLFRHGATLRLLRNSLEFQDAMDLCDHWDDKRLEKLAKIVLTTNDEYIAGTDRSFKIFAMKASWADGRLSEAESGAA